MPIGFNLGLTYPGGPTAMFITLGPGESVYLDTHVIDLPPEIGGPWVMTASSSPTMPGPVTLDTSVLEYPGPVGSVPGTSGMLFSAGGTSGPSIPGAPGIFLEVAIPEPASLALLTFGAAGALLRRRRA